MSLDVTELMSFYDTPLGAVSRRFIARALADFWDGLRGRSLLGVGYPTPYLPVLTGACERALVFMPAGQGVVAWPNCDRPASCLVDTGVLPLADGSVDRVLVVHALETAVSPSELLHEVSRVLVPDGRAVVICPNRRGLWARMDTTPFGEGQPFSRSQLRSLMEQSFLSPERWGETLFVPPLDNRFVLAGASAWERMGGGLMLPFAGLHVVEASKSRHRPVLARDAKRRGRRSPALVPVTATPRTLHGCGCMPPGSTRTAAGQ